MRLTGSNIEIRVNGVTLCYDDWGNGNIPILFVHGFPFDKSMWAAQMEFFQSAHRVIAYDIRGFGQSTDDHENASITLFADDLVKLMDGLMINKAVVCGLSMGGYIVLNAVNRYPERFRGVVLSDTQCIADSRETREGRFKTIQQIEAEGLNTFTDTFLKKIFCKDSLTNKTTVVDKIKNAILSTRQRTITATLAALAGRTEHCSTLNLISIPALILCGKEDVVTPPVQSEFLASRIKNAVLHFIEQAGHLSNLEQPDVFNTHLQDFISEI